MLAEAMGGDLAYERVDGISVFTFTLPTTESSEKPTEEAA